MFKSVLGNRDILSEVDKSDVLDHLAYSLFQFGDKLKAYRLTQELVRMRPNDQRVQDNLNFFQHEVMCELLARMDRVCFCHHGP